MEIYAFDRSEDELRELAADTVRQAKLAGADAAEVSVSESFGLTLCVRSGELETSEFGQDRDAAVRVFCGKRTGSASCGSLNPSDIRTAIDRALAIAAHAEDDECAGLADQQDLASGERPDLDLHHPWRPSVDAALRMAIECEEASFAADSRVSRSKSEGAEVATGEERSAYANSHGFAMAETRSTHSISCSAIAEVPAGNETGDWSSSERNHKALEDAAAVGSKAGSRAASRAGARRAQTAKVPALFEAGNSHRLIGSILGGASGGNLYRKLSYMRDMAGEQVCAGHITVTEDPFVRSGIRSVWCDDEGAAVRKRAIVDKGILTGYLLDSYSARKLGLRTTGNAGGAHNIEVSCATKPLDELLREMGTGFMVTRIMGRGANLVTGDYSCGAEGFWVDNGAIAYPVTEATIAGSLPAMLKGIVAGGSDTLNRGGLACGSLLIDEISLGGQR